MDKKQPHPLFKLATELGPLLIFFIANAKFHLFVATGAFMVAVVAAMIASYVVTRHVPIMALVTGVIVIVFGTLTLVLHDETFIKIKPTIIYSLFAAVLGVNPLQHLLAPGRVLPSLPAARRQAITGREFFPHLISGPFHQGLVVVFAVAAVLSLLAALASLLRGGRYVDPAAADEAPATVSAKRAKR